MSRFFIDRPIFAWVLAIIVMLAGGLAIRLLPISQYPTIAPPAVVISTSYPGASAKVLEDSVTQVIEQKMSGLDHLSYMASSSDSAGHASVTLTFDAGTDPDIAQVQVQNKMQLAVPLLPQEVQRQGIQVNKTSASFLMLLGFISADGSMTDADLGDYVAANVQDFISRLDGVGEVQLFGTQYAMRIWLDPAKLNNFKMMPSDIKTAIQAQNAQVSAGELGGLPAARGQRLNATVTAQSRLQTPDQFRDIILRAAADGSIVRLRDVAEVELGGENYGVDARYNGQAAVGMAIKLTTGANALDTADRVKRAVGEMERNFPPGMKTIYPYDTTPFVRLSIIEVIKTLAEAIGLVFLVMYLFLQNIRATIIPTITIPVVLLGTFGVLAAAGFSINTLTMFAMVLAIGLLVDDAVVVVENVERVMAEEDLPPREATRRSMGQITGALVGIALVLSAVFVPMAFTGGSTGVIYRQFSITIFSAMVLSVLVALILTPALCATMLKPAGVHDAQGKGFGGWFNRNFVRSTLRYQGAVGRILGRPWSTMGAYLGVVAVTGFMFLRLPTAFLPDEDQGFMFLMYQLPPGAVQERSLEVAKRVEKHFLEQETDAVASLFTVTGFSFAGNGQNTGLGFILMKDWDKRPLASQNVFAVAQKATAALAGIRDAMIYVFAPPAVVELGNTTGFDLELQDRAGLGREALIGARDQFLALAARDPTLAAVRPNALEDTAQYQIDVDLDKVGALGLSIADVNDTLSTAWGSAYVNDFIDRGRVKKVLVQADAPSRMLPDDLGKWFVRNAHGDMVPFSAFAAAHWTFGSPRLDRFNGVPAVEILGQPAPGKSSGEAMAAVEALAAQLPQGIGYQWTGLSYQERLSGAQAPALYTISFVVVFLSLAALYESWSIPVAVMLVVPLGIVGALGAAFLRGLPDDVYFQVGLLTTMGLSAKNAILIVEFAKEQAEQGLGLVEATMEAVRMRLRPILMTSLAFMLGVLPLVVAHGAGSGSQHAIGTGVMGGMISATVLAIFFVPVFFLVVRRIFPAKAPAAPRREEPVPADATEER